MGGGTILPLALLFLPGLGKSRCVLMASLATVLGALAFLYVFIIGGQSYPLSIFPGYQATSSFADGVINGYTPSIYEWALGCGGLGAALLVTLIGVRIFPGTVPQDDPRQEVVAN
ncbi:MAG: hypothetical protein G3I09_08255 [Ferrovum sp.]|nr:hypothetical protein [Ferrovum sp.]